MSEHDDEYLWSGQGTASEHVAGLERSLVSLRWRPQELVLPAADAKPPIAEVAALDRARARGSGEVERARANWWPAVAAGLVAAAAVLALLLWPGSDVGGSDRDPAINPVAPPSSPDLKDPFGPRDPAEDAASGPDLKDPFAGQADPPARSVSPDLKDPFARPSDAPTRREPKPRSPDDASSDLKNPFGDSQPEPERADEIVDPFGDRNDPPPTTSPDLKDPFSR